MKRLLAILFLQAAALLGQTAPTYDFYGGLEGAACPTTPTPFSQFSGSQYFQTASAFTSNSFQVNSITETNGQNLQVGEEITVSSATGPVTPIQVTGESTGCGSGVTTCKYTLAHSSVLPNSIKVLVGGTEVANVQYQAVYGEGANLGQITGHATPQLKTSQMFLSLAFATATSGAVTVNYQYEPAEVVQIGSISGTGPYTLTTSTPLKNAHANGDTVSLGYFRTAKINGNKWTMCDPLNHPFLVKGIWDITFDANNHYHQGSPPSAQYSVSTTLTQNVSCGTYPCSLTVGVASTTGIVAAPGMVLDVNDLPPWTNANSKVYALGDQIDDSNGNIEQVVAVDSGWYGTPGTTQPTWPTTVGATVHDGATGTGLTWKLIILGTGNKEKITVTGVNPAGSTITASFTKSHSAGELLQCCNSADVANGKYASISGLNAGLELQYPRYAQWGFNAILPFSTLPYPNRQNTDSLWDSPDGTNPFKWAYFFQTQDGSESRENKWGYAPDILLAAENTGGSENVHFSDFFNAPVLRAFVAGNATWNGNPAENPWLLGYMHDETDYAAGFGEAEHFITWAAPNFANINYGSSVKRASPYNSYNSTGGSSAPSQDNKFYTKLAFSQWLQGRLDPLLFPTQASTSTPNIASISCSGSNVVVNFRTSWLGSHLDPFTPGELVTVFGTTNYNTPDGSPATIVTAVQGSHQVTLSYATSPCPAAMETTGVMAGGPGYQAIGTLNTAWTANATSPSYTTFGSSGTSTSGAAVNCSGTSCSATLSPNVDPGSLQIVASNGTLSYVMAGDDGAGNIRSFPSFSTSLTAAVPSPCNAPCSLTLASTNGNVLPVGLVLKIGSEYGKIIGETAQVGTSIGPNIATVQVTTLSGGEASGTAVTSAIYLPSAGSVTYSTGTISLTLNATLPAGWALTANYHSNGWGNGGTGILDETHASTADGGPAWMGFSVDCIDGPTTAGATACAGTPSYGSATYQRDMDGFHQAFAAYYTRNYLEALRTVAPHVPVVAGYRHMGGRAAPARAGQIRAFGSFVDIGQGDVQYLFCTTRAPNCPTQTKFGTSTQLPTGPLFSSDPQLDAWNFTMYYFGDKPFFDYWQQSATRDSGFNRQTIDCNSSGSSAWDSPNQLDRAMRLQQRLFYTAFAPSVNGTGQGIGGGWWSPYDTALLAQFCNFGFTSENDNLYDGSEATPNPPNPQVVAGYTFTAIPEWNRWGDLLHPVRNGFWAAENAMINAAGTKAQGTGKLNLAGQVRMP
jgi:hypothetical protein